MFWNANFNAAKELNVLLKQENVTLTQVLETDDILQECKADNKTLMQFLTKPKILAELITLITEEPPKNVELASQYRHASIACEVLTSHLSTLSDCLSMDVVQMNRLCDFINKDPPLNPLLASYFSKTVEMLLERCPKKDWYLYHVVCLRVLDFFKSRRDFLPNLLRHISTSAIADTFKYFIRLDDIFNKIIMEWFEEHQFVECLIQIICGTYVPEPLAPCKVEASPDQPEKGLHETSEKTDDVKTNVTDQGLNSEDQNKDSEESSVEEAKEAKEENPVVPVAGVAVLGSDVNVDNNVYAARIAAVASSNAAALLCDLIVSGCVGDGCNTRSRTSWALVSRLQSADGVRLLLQGVFTAPAAARQHALVHGSQVLLAMLDQEPILGAEAEWEFTGIELAVAPHLPLLHQALLEEAAPVAGAGGPAGEGVQGGPAVTGGPWGVGPRRVGLARIKVAALLAHLARSNVQEVCGTMITLGTPGVLLDLFFSHDHNNFLHAQVADFVVRALVNRNYQAEYARHLLVDCDLLTKLMDVFEENENKKAGRPRSGHMGYVVGLLGQLKPALDEALVPLPPALEARWATLRDRALAQLLLQQETPLGGYYPSDNVYEYNDANAAGGLDDVPNEINADGVNEMCSTDARMPGEVEFDEDVKAESDFLELASQRFGDDMWEDSPEADEAEEDAEDSEEDLQRVQNVLMQASPWESSGGGACGGEGWAQFWAFGDDAVDVDLQARAQASAATDGASQENIEENMHNLHLERDLGKLDDSSVELATKLLTAMSSMAPEVVADIVNGVPLPTMALQDEGFSAPLDSLQQTEASPQPLGPEWSANQPGDVAPTNNNQTNTQPLDNVNNPIKDPFLDANPSASLMGNVSDSSKADVAAKSSAEPAIDKVPDTDKSQAVVTEDAAASSASSNQQNVDNNQNVRTDPVDSQVVSSSSDKEQRTPDGKHSEER